MYMYFIIINIKTSGTGPRGENKLFTTCFRNATNTFASVNWKNTTQGSNQRFPAPLNPSNVPVSNTVGMDGHSTTNLGRWEIPCMQIGTFYTLILRTKMDELRPQLDMSTSGRSRWKLTEQTMIRVRINLVQHTQFNNMTSMTEWQETLIRMWACCQTSRHGCRGWD